MDDSPEVLFNYQAVPCPPSRSCVGAAWTSPRRVPTFVSTQLFSVSGQERVPAYWIPLGRTFCHLTICRHKSGGPSRESEERDWGFMSPFSWGLDTFLFQPGHDEHSCKQTNVMFSVFGVGEVKIQPVQARARALALHNNYRRVGSPLEGSFIKCALQFGLAQVLHNFSPGLALLWQSRYTLAFPWWWSLSWLFSFCSLLDEACTAYRVCRASLISWACTMPEKEYFS